MRRGEWRPGAKGPREVVATAAAAAGGAAKAGGPWWEVCGRCWRSGACGSGPWRMRMCDSAGFTFVWDSGTVRDRTRGPGLPRLSEKREVWEPRAERAQGAVLVPKARTLDCC